MSILAALGSAALSALPNIAQTVLPTIVSGVANGIMNGSLTGSGSTSSSGLQNMNQTMSQSGWETSSSMKQGSIAGIANLLGSALTTPTGNNATAAAAFNQQSAQTANDLQAKAWNNANFLNMSSNIIGNMANALSQTSAKNYNSKEQQIARDWQREMRGTAYQDTVKDMQAAGLNPILAASNGATSTPGSGSASISAQGYNQTTAAGIPSAHTATMSSMYDYGNNTAQFVQNATAAINTAKEYGYNQVARGLEQSLSQVTESSAKTISDYAQQQQQQTSSSSSSKTERDWPDLGGSGEGFSGSGGGEGHGAGGGRGR